MGARPEDPVDSLSALGDSVAKFGNPTALLGRGIALPRKLFPRRPRCRACPRAGLPLPPGLLVRDVIRDGARTLGMDAIGGLLVVVRGDLVQVSGSLVRIG